MSTSAAPDPAHADTLPEDRVPVGTKIAMGVGNMVGQFTSNLTKELINPVYVVALGLSPALTGIGMIIFRIYDAINDPIMGWISDNTRSRWGRRRPWMFLGTLLCALVMPLMWMVHRDWDPSIQLAWMIGAGLVLYTATTIYGVPYESLTLELTPDYKERTSVSSYKLVISSIPGLLIGWSWYIIQLPIFHDPATGKPDTLNGAIGLSLIAGVLILICGLAAVFFTRERFYAAASKQAKVSLKETITSTFKCRPFIILVAIGLTAATGTSLWGGLGFFTRLYYTCQGDQVLAAKLTGIQSTCWLPISIASVFVFQRITSRWSKTHALVIALSIALIAVTCRWWTMSPSTPYLSLSSSFLMAIGMTGMWQTLAPMNADVVDSDELQSHARREGAFASTFSWFMKVSFTLGIGLPGLIIGWLGFVVLKGNAQDPGVITSLRLADVFLPGALIATAITLLAFYPLSVGRMGAIRRELEDRRGKL